MVALFFSGTMDSVGLNAHFRAITPQKGGRPPQRGGYPLFWGVNPQNWSIVCPWGLRRPSMAAFHSHPGVNRGQVRGVIFSPSFEEPPIFGRFAVVAVVEKFRSRIRILQFSTGKITPHGCVYVSSARPPIGIVFCVRWV